MTKEKEVKGKEPSKEVKTETIEKELKGKAQNDLSRLEFQLEKCLTGIERLEGEMLVLGPDDFEKGKRLKGEVSDLELRRDLVQRGISKHHQEIAKREREAGLEEADKVYEEAEALLRKAWDEIARVGGYQRTSWKAFKEIIKLSGQFETLQGDYEELCKRWHFEPRRIRVGARDSVTKMGGGHFPSQRNVDEYVTWIRGLCRYYLGQGTDPTGGAPPAKRWEP